ncbi:hypothetical protein N0V83_004494 [Neocucurbitaria cava]|uniref:Uncharacterized protein n=1 Tax=Neocucurbitaria cava TaxID=798079 RepID=A0A9W8Y9A2_9PLEO|nr:hypothetical protein N0V83_004494 [Neocucurbitaria cava]
MAHFKQVMMQLNKYGKVTMPFNNYGKVLVKYAHITAMHERLRNSDLKGDEVTIHQIMEIFDSGEEPRRAFHFEHIDENDPNSPVQLKEQSGFESCQTREFDEYRGFYEWMISKPIPFVYRPPKKAGWSTERRRKKKDRDNAEEAGGGAQINEETEAQADVSGA